MIKKKEEPKVGYNPGNLPVFQIVPIKKLHVPDWYFKRPLSGAAKNKLTRLVKMFGPGAILCRHWSLDHLEVMDGNRRVEIFRELGATEIGCLNYGKIPRELAVIFARSVNHPWGHIDPIAYAKQLKERNKITDKEIAHLTPETLSQVEELSTILDFDWSVFKDNHTEASFMRM